MINVGSTIEAKSDQVNSIDLLDGPRTIVIAAVKVVAGDQPVEIHYEGGEGKPYKPCKSMRRVMVKAWGSDGEKYVGRSLTLFSDPKVVWAGSPVGGLRISHMSDIDGVFRMMLTKSRGQRAMFEAQPLETEEENKLPAKELKRLTKLFEKAMSMADMSEIGADVKKAKYDPAGKEKIREVYSKAVARIRDGETKTETTEKKG